MKNFRPLYLFLVCLLAVILVILFGGGKAPVAESAGSTPVKAVTVAERPMPEEIPMPEAVVEAVEPVAPEVMAEEIAVAEVPEDWVKRTISEEWTDGVEKLAGRQRVRIVEADFKYPNLRLEEVVTTDPETGLEAVTLIRASVADHLMLGLKPGTDEERAADVVRKLGYEVRAIEPGSYILAVLPMFDTAKDHTQAAADLASLEEFINHAEPDYLVFPCVTPNDPAYSQGKMWGLHNPGTSADSTRDADIDAPEGWDIRKDAPGIVVAVTDTGIQYNHEDLAPNMWIHPTNGSHGFDAYENDNNPMDTGGHGTHCAGTIGGRGGNSKGMTGVAWDVKLMAVRFLGPNGGSTSDAIRSVNYARQNGARVISASWGGGGFSQSLYDAIKACGDAGIPFVAAAGNSSTNNDATPHYPSSYKLDNIVSVASTTPKDSLSSFSCYGRTSVDIGAPGSSIWSSYIGSNTSYTYLNGTSMATPHVSGALALAIAHFPSEDMNSIIARLYGSVDKIPALAGRVATGGRLNLARLLGGSPPNVFNDHFADAHRFTDVYGSWVGTNARATREADEDSFAKPGIGNKSLWLAFRTPHAGLVSLDVVSEILGFEIVVFEGGEKGQLKEVAHSGRLGNFYRYIRFNAKADTEYRVVLDTYIFSDQRWRVDYELAPPNDFFVDAIPLSTDVFAVNGYNRGSTGEIFEKAKPHAGTGRGKSVWWSWTAPESGDFIINTSGSAFDTVLAVYTGTNANSLANVASNEDRSPLDWTSQVTIPAVAGTTYHIAVDSFRDDAEGDIKLNGYRSGMLNIIRQPADLSVELGKRAVFDVSVLSDGDVSYQWFFNNKAIPGQTSANLVIDPVRAEDFGNYKVQASNTENLVTSNIAALSEKQSAPELTWSSGNQAVASGTAVTLAAEFSGSEPMSYTWTKNGQPIAGDAATLAFASAQVANAGAYRLTATNTAGSATADFSLSVIASPWERWEWRRPGIPNAAITDIKVYGTEAFAVSATTLLRSTDGMNWRKSVFPNGFSANSIAKAGSLMLCNGLDTAGQFRVATSANNGASWTISATTGYPTVFSPEKYSLIGHKGVFIAYNTVSNSNGSDFFRSTNGTSWTRITATNLTNTSVNLSGKGSIASDGNTLILISAVSTDSGRMRHFRSTDGIAWKEYETNNTDSGGSSFPSTAFFDGTKFYLFGVYSIYSSPDGVNWQVYSAPSNGFNYDGLFASNGNEVIMFAAGYQHMRYFSDPSDRKFRGIQPANSHAFTAAASFGNKVLFGTDKGLLALAGGSSDVSIPREKSSILRSVEFTENLFIARTDVPSYANDSAIDLLSGDGVTWKQNTPLDTPNVIRTGSASGKHFGRRDFLTAIYSGHNPFDVRLNAGDTIGLAPNISFIDQLPNGNALAVTSPSSGASSLLARANGATTWSAASFPLGIGSTSRFASLGNRWFSNAGSGSSALIYTSTTGTSWTSTGLTGSMPQFVTFGGKSWCIFRNSSSAVMAANSTNDTTWTTLSTSGLPSGFVIRRVADFGANLVMLGGDENLYFSSNGTTWLRGTTPGKVVDIAAGNGQLLAIMKNGGIIQTGSPHAGGSAPLVRIVSPQTASTHLIGSRITVEGTVSDPEDGEASYDCYVDSQLVASGTGYTFRFQVTMTDPAGHTVTVRARDSQGLRQMDAIRLRVAAAQTDNLLANTQGGAIPATQSVVFDGVFYAAGNRSIFRSLDGKSWEKVPIPSFANSIYGMASGNGALVIQFDNGGIMSTRDGVNWTHFQPNLTDYWVRERVQFASGMFIAAYQNQGTTSGSVMTSTDGLTWQAGAVSDEGYLAWTASSGDGMVIGAAAYGEGGYKTLDNGFNWIPIPALQAAGSHSIGIFSDDRFFVVLPSWSSPKILISSDAAADVWQEHPLPADIRYSPQFIRLNGTFFLGSDNKYTHTSADGVTWQALSAPISGRKIVHSRGLFVCEAFNGGILTSRDGQVWNTVQGLPSRISQILANEDFYLLISSDGAVWRSRDGEAWESTVAGGASTTFDSRVGQSLAALKGRIVTAGSGILVTSADNGRTWSNATVNGVPANTGVMFSNVVSNESQMLVIQGDSSSGKILLRSIDGAAFTTVAGLADKSWADCAWNGSEWILIATDGSLFRSKNGGVTWVQLAVTGIARGAAVAWINSRWVVIGAALSGFNTPYVGFTLGAGDTLQNHGNIGFFNSNMPVRTLTAHGRLLIWTQGEKTFVTSDGSSWAATSLGAGAGNHDYDIYHTPDGFTAFKGSVVSYYPVEAWSAGTTALTWSAIPSPFNSIEYAENLGDRVFLFARGTIAELHDKDLAVTLPALSGVTLGVGDKVSANVTIRNFGRSIPPGSAWKITAWLAKNRFYGDTKNVPLGTFDITSPMPAPGASQSYPVAFTLPNEILTGANHLILQLSGPDGIRESNTANNTVISDTAFVTIPEWEFAVATNGNGQVLRDFAATRYPHKAQVSLTASAGKGATFTGWAGDALSPNDQITILMTGNKSVQANFSNRATLQIVVNGMGEVTGLPDFGSYPVGNTAAITAVAAPGWVFSHWSGASSVKTPAASVLMNVSKSATANFVLPLATWKSLRFSPTQLANSAISGDNMDPDNDGVTTWMEYLHGSHPMDRSSTGATPFTIENGFLRCVYTRNLGAAGGASLTCQAGRDLTNWVSPDLQQRILSTVDGVETVEARLPVAGKDMGFLRFQYIPAQP